MGGGSWNGKNFGGLHTSDGKNLKRGPYSSNGYIPDQRESHLNYLPGDNVFYVGTSKNKSKYYIPNGSAGTILTKDNSNKLRKSSRSLFKVDFKEYGVRYVHKNVLQLEDDYSDFIEFMLDTCELKEGIQSYRNKAKQKIKGMMNSQKYESILKNRQSNKAFREWRKEFLDNKLLSLNQEIFELSSNDTLTAYKQRSIELKQLISQLKLKDDMSEEEQLTLTKYKDEYKTIQNYFDENKSKIKLLEGYIQSPNRQYVYQVNCVRDYNNYLHAIKNNDNYVYQSVPKPSMNYEVLDNVVSKNPPNINFLQWGLYPQDVN